jgi:hypothetical protein
MVKKTNTCNIIKYAKEIKEIALKEGNGMHEPEVENGHNNYMVCGDILVVKAEIRGRKYIDDKNIKIKDEGYFIIEKNDIDLLAHNYFVIYIHVGLGKYSNLPV